MIFVVLFGRTPCLAQGWSQRPDPNFGNHRFRVKCVVFVVRASGEIACVYSENGFFSRGTKPFPPPHILHGATNFGELGSDPEGRTASKLEDGTAAVEKAAGPLLHEPRRSCSEEPILFLPQNCVSLVCTQVYKKQGAWKRENPVCFVNYAQMTAISPRPNQCVLEQRRQFMQELIGAVAIASANPDTRRHKFVALWSMPQTCAVPYQ